MKNHKWFKLIMVIIGMVACSQVASAKIVFLADHGLEVVRGQAGIVSIGLDSLGTRAMFAVNCLGRTQEVAVRKNIQRVDLGVFQEDAILTLEGIELTGFVHTGSSFAEVVENDGNEAIHCHFEKYGLTMDSLKVNAVYVGGDTQGASFGAFEMTGFSMEMSGDVTIWMHH